MRKFVYFIIVTLIVVACGSPRPAALPPELPDAERRVATYVFGEAAKQYALGNHDAAYELLWQTLRLNPRHAPSMYLLTQYENYLRHSAAADSLLSLALAIDPDNIDYLEMDVALSERSGDVDRTVEALERLAQIRPRNLSVLSSLSQYYMKAGQGDSAISVLTRMENIQGVTQQTANTKQMLRLALGDTIGGMNELRRLVEEYPNDPNYAVMLGNAYSRVLDCNDTAQIILDRVAAIDPTNASLQVARLNLYERTDSALYQAYYDSLLYGRGTDTDLRGRLMFRYIGQHQNDSLGREKTIAMFDSVLTLPQEDARLLTTYAAYLMAMHVGDDTITNVLNRVIDIEPSNRAALIELLQRHARANDSRQVARVCDQAITYYPHEAIFYYYSGMGYYMDGDTLTALERITDGCEHITDETPSAQAADMFVMQGDILHGLGRIDEAFAAYDSCLVYQPDNIPCLNNYAYFLSLEGRDLDKAEQMSYRTVRAMPDSRTYLDTYAWILFLQERYDEAATYMDRVMDGIDTETEDEPEDISADVFEHAGDIYACQGNVDKALSYWKAAQRFGCKSRTLARKIKRKQYVRE